MNRQFLRRVGFHMDIPANANHDYLIPAIEAACVTEQELNADPDSCVTRIRGAMEELDPVLAEDFWEDDRRSVHVTRRAGSITGRLVSKGPNMQTISPLSLEDKKKFSSLREAVARQLYGKD